MYIGTAVAGQVPDDQAGASRYPKQDYITTPSLRGT